jgi:hypothetical protein
MIDYPREIAMYGFYPQKSAPDPTTLSKAHERAALQLAALETGPANAATGLRNLSFWYGAAAVSAAKPAPYEQIALSVDWAAWRSEFEYFALWRRSDCLAGDASESVGASIALERTLALCLMRREDEAIDHLRKWGGGIEKTVARMRLAKDRPQIEAGDLGAIGLLYERLLGRVPNDPAFVWDPTLLSAQGRARILRARKAYANASSEGGYLLGGYAHEIIPLELIFLNQCSPADQRDAGLSALASAVEGTVYPEDPFLEACDRILTGIGH